jgi:hypothetical protein
MAEWSTDMAFLSYTSQVAGGSGVMVRTAPRALIESRQDGQEWMERAWLNGVCGRGISRTVTVARLPHAQRIVSAALVGSVARAGRVSWPVQAWWQQTGQSADSHLTAPRPRPAGHPRSPARVVGRR